MYQASNFNKTFLEPTEFDVLGLSFKSVCLMVLISYTNYSSLHLANNMGK